jgi:glucose-6-phosphate-specific signal transduction histidine kinase
MDRPEWVDADPDFSVWEWSPNSTQEARKAGRVLRGVTLGFFGLTWLMAMANLVRGGGLATNASVVLLAVCYFLGGWFWPWYALWPLASAAFVPKSRVAWFSVLLSAGVLTLYATINGPPDLERFRSLFAFGLPLILFATTFRFAGKLTS